jgi:hypothetical protein
MHTQENSPSKEKTSHDYVIQGVLTIAAWAYFVWLYCNKNTVSDVVFNISIAVLLLQAVWFMKCLLFPQSLNTEPLKGPYFKSPTGDEPLKKDEFPKYLKFDKVYDPPTTWVMAECCRLAYREKHAVAEILTKIGFEDIFFFDTAGTQSFLASHPGKESDGKPFAILAFRGTEKDYFDILTDGLIIKRKLKDEEFASHSGYLTALQRVWGTGLKIEGVEKTIDASTRHWYGSKGISNAIQKVQEKYPNTQLFITGHSLGGGIATLAAHKLAPKDSKSTAMLYTFGSPRVADVALANHLDGRENNITSFRIVHRLDIAPHLPAYVPILFDYQHVQKLVYHNFFKKNCCIDPAWSKGGFLTAIFGTLLTYFMVAIMCGEIVFWVLNKGLTFGSEGCRYEPWVFKDHRICDYVDLLKPEES